MTQDEIIDRGEVLKMAKQAGLAIWHKDLKKWQLEYGVEAFAKLVDAKATAKEREACAKVCDVIIVGDEYATALVNSYADKIRSRGEIK